SSLGQPWRTHRMVDPATRSAPESSRPARVGIVRVAPRCPTPPARPMPQTENDLRTRPVPSLAGPVDPARFVETTGERIALFGREDGPFEVWAWPLKLCSDLYFGVRREGQPFELPEREITVQPGELTAVWKRAGVQLRIEAFACRERPGLAFGFALDSDQPLELEVSFRCDFRPQWPAGLGGQLATVDTVTGAFALSDEL